MKKKEEAITIAPPKFQTAEFSIVGTAPFVQSRFSEKAKATMRGVQEAGSTVKKGKKREPKDFNQCYLDSMYEEAIEGWRGIPASAFRNAMVSACKIVGYQMTRAKLSVFVEADGWDKDGNTPLVKITEGAPEQFESFVRIQQTTDIRVRALWRAGWKAKVRVRFDADQFTLADVANLMMRVGMQVGVGEGRPDSKSSCGMGWGLFSIEESAQATKAA